MWKFDHVDPGPGRKVRARDRMNRTVASVAAADGLVVAPDSSGFVHCLDARTGRRLWFHDLEATAVQRLIGAALGNVAGDEPFPPLWSGSLPQAPVQWLVGDTLGTFDAALES